MVGLRKSDEPFSTGDVARREICCAPAGKPLQQTAIAAANLITVVPINPMDLWVFMNYV